jgi:hypothetical protein
MRPPPVKRQDGPSSGDEDAAETEYPSREVNLLYRFHCFGARRDLHQTLVEVHSFLFLKA